MGSIPSSGVQIPPPANMERYANWLSERVANSSGFNRPLWVQIPHAPPKYGEMVESGLLQRS